MTAEQKVANALATFTGMNRSQRKDWRHYVMGCDLSAAQRLVLLALEGFADYPAGTNARPGVALLAQTCNLKPSAVEKALARARDLTLIQQTGRANPKRNLAAVYRLVPVPISTRTAVQVETDSTRTAVRTENGFNPYGNEFQPVRDDVSTRTYVQPTNPLTPNKNTKGGSTRGTRIPDDWRPPPELVAQMRDHHPQVDVDSEIEQFRDYWTSESGTRATKRDWNAAFRVWIRREDKHRGTRSDPNAPSAYDAKKAHNAAVFHSLADDDQIPGPRELTR